MKLPKVIHVELREPYNGKRHFYFGSIAAIFDELSEEQIGSWACRSSRWGRMRSCPRRPCRRRPCRKRRTGRPDGVRPYA